MTHPVKGVDHVFLMVNSLDESCEAFARLGFTISPRGMHSAHKGAANHTIMFPNDYFELLGMIAEVPGNADRRAMLAREGQGLHAVACRIDDAYAAKAGLAELGIATEEVGSFSRPVPLPDGSEGMASFDTLKFETHEYPLGTAFMCRHKTRDMVWVPSLLEHPNGAQGIAGVVAGCDDPDGAAVAFARLFAEGAISHVDGGAVVSTGVAGGPPSAPITLLTRAALAAAYPEMDFSKTPKGAFAVLRIDCPDLKAVHAILDQEKIPFSETPLGVAVGPDHACGCVVEFVGE
ncbi:MAG: VOC family protein [Pseudomonadota bacterium]|nr:VOC family protein [Pseudomonadota bacterium]